MSDSASLQTISPVTRGWRHFAAWVCNNVVVPVRCVNQEAAMAATYPLLEEGYGVLNVINHFSRRDPVQILALLLGDRVLSSRPLMAPVAFHQNSGVVRALAGSFGVDLEPVVTGHTRRRMKNRAPRQSGLDRYLARAVETFQNGGVVLLAPQGRRRSLLGAPPYGRPMQLLLGAALDAGVERVALLFIGLAIPEATTYDRRVVGGLNLFRSYEARYGMPVTLRQALDEAGDREKLDAWTFTRMAELVPAEYVKPSGPAGPPPEPPPDSRGRGLGLGEDVDD